MSIAEAILACAAAYAAAGAAFAAAFHARGLLRMDPAAAGAGIAFRILITPGIVALWPLLLRRWLRGESGDVSQPAAAPAGIRARHRLAWQLLAAVLPAILGVAIATRAADSVASGPALVRGAAPLGEVLREDAATLERHGITLRIRSDGAAYQLEAIAARPLAAPDVALYWLPQSKATTGNISDALFVGTVAGSATRRHPIPPRIANEPGVFYLFSMTHGERLGGSE